LLLFRFDAIKAKQSAVVAGYDPIVVENQDVYERLLLRATNLSSLSIGDYREEVEEKSSSPIIDKVIESCTSLEMKTNQHKRDKVKTKRQTPLVNAGYASRVLSISYTIRSFISYHEFMGLPFSVQQEQLKGGREKIRPRQRRIRLVFLGCGVDVIGFWARSLLLPKEVDDNEDKQSPPLSVTIVEVDTPEVVSIKKKMILSNGGMVKNLTEHCYDLHGTSFYYTGDLIVPSSKPSSPSPSSENKNDYDYVLVPADLKDTSTLEVIVEIEEDDIPTLVISELVLSYLPPPSTDQLLRWCSDRLCRTSDSALISLEALGFDTTVSVRGSNGGIISVADGYRREYCRRFDEKMKLGKRLSSSNSLFHPIGSSTEQVSIRLRKAGFSEASSAANLGVVASVAAAAVSSTSKTPLICPEIFDEHAAFSLHLLSYVLVCGLIDISQQKMNQSEDPIDFSLLRSLLCPWERPNALAFVRAGLPIIDLRKGIAYTEIESIDEGQVRDMFKSTYDIYKDDYPAIRKMVKGVLNNDLMKTTTTNYNSSAISDYYRSLGGVFLVAVRYTDSSSLKYDNDDGNNDDTKKIHQNCRKVVGCVGIRSCEAKDADASRTLEIFRLAVDINYRGQGIARNLLQAVERYALEQRRNHSLKFVANTLTILNAAADLYESCGYQAEKEKPLGNKLLMRKYVKESILPR